MSETKNEAFDAKSFLANNPEFKRLLFQFIALRDAAEILRKLNPPYAEVAALYLEEVANHLTTEAGIPEQMISVLISSRPRCTVSKFWCA